MAKLIDHTGRRYGELTALRRDGTWRGTAHAAWLCRCSCGKTVRVRGSLLVTGRTRSCGHLRRRNYDSWAS